MTSNERSYRIVQMLKAQLESNGVADAIGVLKRGAIGSRKARIWVDVAAQDEQAVGGFKRIEMHL